MSERGSLTPLRELPRAEPPSTEASRAEPDAQRASAARYRRRVLLVLSAIALALFLYWASGYVFAYTDDAYVTSDFVNVAPMSAVGSSE
jgi:multidrug resistance efflux pump